MGKHQLVMPPIIKDCLTTSYAAPCEWKKLSEHIRTSNFDCFKKSVKIMVFRQKYGWILTGNNNVYSIVISVVITVNYCKCIILL